MAAPLPAVDWRGLEPVGAAEKVSRTPQGVQVTCADGASVTVSVLASDLVRVRTIFAGQKDEPDHSWAIARTDWTSPTWQLAEGAEAVSLTTTELKVVIHRSPLRIEFLDAASGRVINADQRPMARDVKSGRVAAAKRLGFDEHFYGLGEKAAHLDRRRGEFTMWNSDTPGYTEGTDPIYQSIPFYLGWEDGRAYGLFYDNSHRTRFDLGHTGQEAAAYEAESGVLDYYFFAGPSMKKILGRYTELTGRMPLPPLWALGHQQSRYSYYPASLVEEVARQYRARDLPLDVLYLDIHYMNGYRVFTWDPSRFPDPSALTKTLGNLGVKLVTIIDPGIKYQPPADGRANRPGEPLSPRPELAPQSDNYYVFNQGLAQNFFLRRPDGSLYLPEVWPGKSVFADYTRDDARRWWGDLHRALTDHGVAGVWTDMNEPSDFVDKSGASQKDVVFDDLGTRSLFGKNRNVFALNMARATYEGLQRLQPDKRPFVITRAGYAGIQRYSTMWTGDNNATFDSLALNIPMFASLGLSGEAFVGSDLPGFIGRGDGELLVRSYEMACFVPLLRNHGAVDMYDHEPWRYGAPYEDIVRKYLKLRYRLLPFLYTTLEEAHRTGVPLFRPLLLNFQDDANLLNLDDEFMIGDALLVAPVVRAAERGREVYLPKGRWYDFWSATPIAGGTMQRVEAPLDHLPLYVRGGSIVPSTDSMNYTGEKPWSPLRFDVYPDEQGNATGSLYEDDGVSPAYLRGESRRTVVNCKRDGNATVVSFAAPAGNYRTAARNYEVTLHAQPTGTNVFVDGQALPEISSTSTAPGWLRRDAQTVIVRLADDGHAHEVQIR